MEHLTIGHYTNVQNNHYTKVQPASKINSLMHMQRAHASRPPPQRSKIIHGLEAAVSMAHCRRFLTAIVLHNKICDEKREKLSLIETNVSCTLSPSWPQRGSLLRDERAPFLPEEIVPASTYGSLNKNWDTAPNLHLRWISMRMKINAQSTSKKHP